MTPTPSDTPPSAFTPRTVAGYCLRLLEGGALSDKLVPPAGLADVPHEARFVAWPARDAAIALCPDKPARLPKLAQLSDPVAAARTLSRFAHHELMAVELFAWALLAYPDAPPALRRGLLQALAEEQIHLGLYLDVLEERGHPFGSFPLSGYFWDVLPTGADDHPGLLGFLAGMGLTLEQANLDFTLLYRDAFARAGDDRVAAILQRIHDDEIGHVALARTWFEKLNRRPLPDGYADHVPFPLSAARAKGRRFDVGARKKAGLSCAMIEYVQHKKPYEQT